MHHAKGQGIKIRYKFALAQIHSRAVRLALGAPVEPLAVGGLATFAQQLKNAAAFLAACGAGAAPVFPVCAACAAVQVFFTATASKKGVFFVNGGFVHPAHSGQRAAHGAIPLPPHITHFPRGFIARRYYERGQRTQYGRNNKPCHKVQHQGVYINFFGQPFKRFFVA